MAAPTRTSVTVIEDRMRAQLRELERARLTHTQHPTAGTSLALRIAEGRLNQLIDEWSKAKIQQQADALAAGKDTEGQWNA